MKIGLENGKSIHILDSRYIQFLSSIGAKIQLSNYNVSELITPRIATDSNFFVCNIRLSDLAQIVRKVF